MKENGPYEALANAIVISAAKDYLKAYKKFLKTGRGRIDVEHEEKFFYSRWYSVLTDVDPDYLLTRLRNKAKEEIEAKKKKYFEDDEEEVLPIDE